MTQLATVHTLDLNFLELPHAIAAYLVPHAHGALLIESGPGSTLPALQRGLQAHGFQASDVTDVLLTHIHLDHAGAAGWLARQGARIHVHPNGAAHLRNPEKLIASASRIYGELMDTLWGEFLPVPEEKLNVLQDGDVLELGELRFEAIDTPGHANHHYAYRFQDLVFTGDVAGVRLPGPPHLRVPMPPPEFNLEQWRQSIDRLCQLEASRLAPTHFGIFDDAAWHLAEMQQALNEIEAWMEGLLPGDPPVEEINRRFMAWTRQRSQAQGLDQALIDSYEAANPSWMSAAGMQRYWKKNRVRGSLGNS